MGGSCDSIGQLGERPCLSHVPHRRALNISDGSTIDDLTAEDMAKLRWVTPDVVVRLDFTEWTHAGVLRHPKFRGIREDKSARQVMREKSAVRMVCVYFELNHTGSAA